MMKARRAPLKRTMVNLLLDSTIFLAFLVTTAPRLSGLAVHEWLGIAFGAGLVAHLLLHWNWIVQVTRRLFGKVAWSARVNYILNILLFIAFTTVIVTGLLISEVALPVLGLRPAHDRLWMNLHRLASDATVLLIGLHLALHWSWIVGAFRHLFNRRKLQGVRPAAQPAAAPIAEEAH